MQKMQRVVTYIAIAVAGTTAVVAFVAFLLSRPHVVPLGGAWVATTPMSMIIESGRSHEYLQRRVGLRRRTVADDPSAYSYIGDDCMIFVIFGEGYELRAACGDRQWIPVAQSLTRPEHWEEMDSDPVHFGSRVFGRADIKDHARRGLSMLQ
jgi:hypothetical protein